MDGRGFGLFEGRNPKPWKVSMIAPASTGFDVEVAHLPSSTLELGIQSILEGLPTPIQPPAGLGWEGEGGTTWISTTLKLKGLDGTKSH
jgi:hypothetical protein